MHRVLAAIVGLALGALADAGLAQEAPAEGEPTETTTDTAVSPDGDGGDVYATPDADGDNSVNADGTDHVYDDLGPGPQVGEQTTVVESGPPAADPSASDSAATDAGTEPAADDAAAPPPAPVEGETIPEVSNVDMSMEDGSATELGNPSGSNLPSADAAPGTVEGVPAETSDEAAPATEPAPETAAAPAPVSAYAPAACGDFPSWYDAQLAYEDAGGLAADPALVAAVDPDYDGIACEEAMIV